MAIFKAGILASGISGEVGGAAFVNAKGSKVIRRPATRTNKSTQIQMARRIAVATLARRWQAFTDAHRTEWRSTARNRSYPNRLGDHRPLTGWQLYLKQGLLTWPFTLMVPLYSPQLVALPAPVGVSADFELSGDYDVTFPVPDYTTGVAQDLWINLDYTTNARISVNNWRHLGAFSAVDATHDWRIHIERTMGELFLGQFIHLRARFTSASFLFSPFISLTTTVAA